MASRKYSARLGILSDEQLQTALDRFGLGRLLSAEPLTNGLFGQNLLLETTEGGFVFRGAPHWNPAGEDDWQFPKERFFSRLMHEAPGGPPVAWPYLLDEGRDIFGWGYAIQPRLAGRPLALPMPAHHSEDDMRLQSRELGRALAAVHTIRLPFPGRHDPRTDRLMPFATSYAGYVEGTIEEILTRAARASGSTSEADLAWARSVIAAGRAAMELPFIATVVHLDFGFHNALFERDEGQWRLTGIIDWMTAESGHPEADLARPLAVFEQDQIPGRDAFLAAYRQTHPELPGFRERFPVFMLWERSLIWEYWQRNKGFRTGLGMREWMEPFVTMIV